MTTERGREVVDMMERQTINIMCVCRMQDGKGKKQKNWIMDSLFTLWERTENGMTLGKW